MFALFHDFKVFPSLILRKVSMVEDSGCGRRLLVLPHTALTRRTEYPRKKPGILYPQLTTPSDLLLITRPHFLKLLEQEY